MKSIELPFDFNSLLQATNHIEIMKGVQDFHENLPDIATKFKDENEINLYQQRSNAVAEMLFQYQTGISLNDKTPEEIRKIITKHYLSQNYTSKQAIAKEFECDKKTLNKWLNYLFGNRFNGRKKITYGEYREIFAALFLYDGEEFNLNDKLEVFAERKSDYINLCKAEIAEIVDEDIKIVRDNLKNDELYNIADKFPPALAKRLVEGMQSEMKV